MCNFKTIKDAADVAIATMLSGIQVCQLWNKNAFVELISMCISGNLQCYCSLPIFMFSFYMTRFQEWNCWMRFR
jgi:D-lactate dehydrogenase (cytochrome)